MAAKVCTGCGKRVPLLGPAVYKGRISFRRYNFLCDECKVNPPKQSVTRMTPTEQTTTIRHTRIVSQEFIRERILMKLRTK